MEKKQSFKNVLIVICTAAIITAGYMFMITRSTLWDRDEPRFARSAVEMIESGKYLVPTFNNELWADKPVLVYWLMTASIKMFGNSEFACRFWSALGTGISCIMTFLIGQRLFGFKQGLLAMIVFATSTMILVLGTMATSDSATLPFTLSAMAIFTYGLTSKFKYYHIISIGLLMGLGMLAKGPIGLMPMPVMFLTFWFTRKDVDNFFDGFSYVVVAVNIACVVFMIWGMQANAATDGEFLKVFIGRHVIERAAKPMEHHGGNFWLYLPYYIPVVIGGLFPWTLFLPGGLSALIGGRLAESKPKKMLLVWTISIVVIMSLAATKLPHYIIFIWPGLALIVAAVIAAFEEGRLSDRDVKWLKKGVWFFAPIGSIVGLGMLAAAFLADLDDIRLPAMLCGIIMLAMTAAACVNVYKNKMAKAAYILIIGMYVFNVPHLLGVLPAIESRKIPPRLARQINEISSADVPVATYKFGEPSLNYYLGRTLTKLGNSDQFLEWLNKDEQTLIVISRENLDKIEEKCGKQDVSVLASVQGIDYSKNDKVIEIVVISNNK